MSTATMKKIPGTSNAYSNWFDVMDEWLDDVKVVKDELKTWSWVLWNDLPYAEPIDDGFTHYITGQFIHGHAMLDTIENMIDQARLPVEDLGNKSLATVKKNMDKFFHDLLKKAQTTEITPIRSGLLARGAENVISYMKADPRYRDDMEYKGWALTND